MKKVIVFIAAVVTIIAGGIAIYQFLNPKTTPPPSAPIKELSITEKLIGTYTLDSWMKANRKIDLGIKVIEGKLKVNSSGIFDWDVILSQAHTPNPKKARITARGRFLSSSMTVEGQQGAKYNVTSDVGRPYWGNVSASEELAMRGWTFNRPEKWRTDKKKEDPYKISYDKYSTGKVIVNMKNSWGTFTWVK